MNQLNNEGFINLNSLEVILNLFEGEDEESKHHWEHSTKISYFKATIDFLRENQCNKLADLFAKELEELRK